MNNQPNIFNYAKSELTQDAFIIWLLHWANPTYKIQNVQLHELGTSFLQSLVAFRNITIGEISELDIKPQYKKIDVFVTFKMNECIYGIIVEDKVHSSDHSNQLERYINKISELKTCNVLVPIYFKTGYQVNLSRIIENKYHHYTVKDFLSVLTPEKVNAIDHDILSQYHSYLLQKENEFDNAEIESNCYLTTPINDWKWWSCVRFFHDYKIHFNAKWGEVANNRERLLAFWFGSREITVTSDDNQLIVLNLYMDVVFGKKQIQVSYRINLLGNEQKNAFIKNQIYEPFLPFLKENKIEVRKAKFTQAKRSLLLAQISNLDRNMKYESFVEKIEHYQKALNKFVDSRI